MLENVTETINAVVRKVLAVITVKWRMEINFIQKAIAKNHVDMGAFVCQITNANATKDGPVAFATNVVIFTQNEKKTAY